MSKNFEVENWTWTEDLDEEFQDGYNSEGYDEDGFGPDGLDEFGFDRNGEIEIGPFVAHRSDFDSEPDDHYGDIPSLNGFIRINVSGYEETATLYLTLWKRQLTQEENDGSYRFDTDNFGKHTVNLYAGDAIIDNEDCLSPMLVFDLWLRADCMSHDEYESRGGTYYSHETGGFSF